MMLPKSVNHVIEQEIKCAKENDLIQLIRRKGGLEEQLKDICTGRRGKSGSAVKTEARGSIFSLLPDRKAMELLEFWLKFHTGFDFPYFSIFYSKRKFCVYFSLFDKGTEQSLSADENRFISLLADRKFLFLEDNEHGNNPDYPPMSEIIRNPERYLTLKQLPEKPSAEQTADEKMRKNAQVVLQQGFVPTDAHGRAYDELRGNEKDIRAALRQRKELLQRSTQFPKFTISISRSEEAPAAIDKELSQLFHDYVYALRYKAYGKKYEELIGSAQENSLSAIMSVRRYLEKESETSICRALIFWDLFTQEMTKLATGTIKDFKFRMSNRKSGKRLTRQTQAPSYLRIECQIMLFDYLLKLLPPEGGDQEIAYAKFQFHVFTKYNKYTHFRVHDIKTLKYDPVIGCKFDFNLLPDSKDCVDYLGGVIRRHILRCICNDVRWLTPGLPNNWSINSSILATLLLQDNSRFPKIHRLTNRINTFLNGKGRETIKMYLNFKGGQSELIEQLESWCIQNDLIFEEDIPSSDMEISDDKMKLLCSRLVLEYMLKDGALRDVRKGLAAIAQGFWGDLLLEGFETFYLEEDT